MVAFRSLKWLTTYSGEYLRVNFIGKDEQTLGLSEALQKQLSHEGSYVLALTFSQATAAAESSTRTEDKVTQLASQVQDVSQITQESAMKDIEQKQVDHIKATLRTTAVDDVDDIYSQQLRVMLKGSGTWLQKEALFDL